MPVTMPPTRQARVSDDIAPLLYLSAPALYDLYFGGRDRAIAAVRRLASRPGHVGGYDVCMVAEDDRGLIGVLAGYPQSEAAARGRRATLGAFLVTAARHLPRLAFLEWLERDAELPVPGGAWYVDALAVVPGARRHGVGRALLAAAEQRGRETGCERLALETEVANAPARGLYEAAGMTAGAVVAVPRLLTRLEPGTRGWVSYAKAL